MIRFIEVYRNNKNPGYDASCPLFRNTYTILNDIMQPYYDGEKSFEECCRSGGLFQNLLFRVKRSVIQLHHLKERDAVLKEIRELGSGLRFLSLRFLPVLHNPLRS